MSKIIIVHLSQDCEIEICYDDYDIEQIKGHLFCCYQDRVQTFINPLDYAYIESTSTHHILWHPIDSRNHVLDMYSKSMSLLYEKLRCVGLKQFWRIQSSYIVNSRCITRFAEEKIYLRNRRMPLPIGEEYVKKFKNKIVII